MTTIDAQFHQAKDGTSRLPYIRQYSEIDFTCNGSEGSITFDGYYYIENHAPPYPEDDLLEPWDRPSRQSIWLPQILLLNIKIKEKEPYKEVDNGGWTDKFYNILDEKNYLIEVYKKVIHESTDEYSEEGTICFFPTNKQTLYFKVLDISA